MVLSGQSGMGKSSLARQMMACWALARPFRGMKCNGSLKSLEIQAEDSRGDIGEVRRSFDHCMKLSKEEKGILHERMLILTVRDRRGPAFLDRLHRLVDKHRPDLVWINPLQSYLLGDITEARDLAEFFTGLNAINAECRFGYSIVHHTTKPATGKDRAERLWHEVMYDMAGGALIINWARAIMSLRASAEPGEFNLVLAKRGTRAGVTREVEQGVGVRDEIVTTIPLAWSKEEIEIPGRKRRMKALFWEERSPDPAPAKHAGGRNKIHQFSTYKDAFPKDPKKAATVAILGRAFKEFGSPGKAAFYSIIDGAVADGLVVRVMVDGHPRYYLK
jgi:hypothetical protein